MAQHTRRTPGIGRQNSVPALAPRLGACGYHLAAAHSDVLHHNRYTTAAVSSLVSNAQ